MSDDPRARGRGASSPEPPHSSRATRRCAPPTRALDHGRPDRLPARRGRAGGSRVSRATPAGSSTPTSTAASRASSACYAAGDGTIGAIKQGGLAAQQADAVVEHVAGLTRGDVLSAPAAAGAARAPADRGRAALPPRGAERSRRHVDAVGSAAVVAPEQDRVHLAEPAARPAWTLLAHPTRPLPTGGIARSPSA